MLESVMLQLSIFDGDTVTTKGKCGKKTMVTAAIVPGTDVSALSASVTALTGEGTLYSGAIGMMYNVMINIGGPKRRPRHGLPGAECGLW